MATPWGDEYIELSYTSGTVQTFLIGSRAVWCGNPSAFYSVGPSVGRNLQVAGANGTLARNRRRGQLPVDLGDIHCDGQWNDDNSPVTADTRANAKTHLRSLLTFLDDAPARQLTVTWHDGDDTYEAPCQFEEHSTPVWEGSDFVTVSVLLTVNTGKLELVESGS